MKTYRCVEEFEVEDYYVDRLSLWETRYSDNYMTELKDNRDIHICLSNDILEEHFEEVK